MAMEVLVSGLYLYVYFAKFELLTHCRHVFLAGLLNSECGEARVGRH